MSLILTGNASSLTIDSTNGITFPSATTQNTAYQTRFKNRIINGDMRIDQRNAGASVTQTSANALYPVDRFAIYGTSSSKFTAQQNAGSVTPPSGFNKYLGITSSAATSVSGSDYYRIYQSIEGLNLADISYGTANAKTMTLSFQVYSSLTGTFGGSIYNASANKSYPFSYTISSSNTWTTASITFSGDTSSAIATDNTTGFLITWGLGVGSTYGSGTAGAWASGNIMCPSGSTSVVGTNGATFYITGVQLEVGSVASAFEYVDYGTQLIQCQRYYQLVNACTGVAVSSTSVQMIVQFPVTMRDTPGSVSMSTARVTDYIANDYTSSSPSVGVNNSSATGGRYTINGFSGMTGGRATGMLSTGGSAAPFYISAEL